MSEEHITRDALVANYHKQAFRKILLLIVSIAGIVLVVGLLSVSVYDTLSLKEAYEIIWNHIIGVSYEPRTEEWWADRYIWNRAIPRLVVGIVAGISLAVGGALMQALMNNPLADPYSTGISSGACFGAVTAIVMGFSFSTVVGEMGIVSSAFIGAMIPAMIIILISKKINVTPATMILIGSALSYFFNSMVTYLMVTTDADTLQDAFLWQIGSLDGITWSDVPIMLVVTMIGVFFVMYMSRQLNILSLGDTSAKSLGLDVDRFRLICLALMAIMICVVVSYTGIIGFIGLVAPHIVRLFIGSDNKYVLPISMSVGALLLLIADYIAMCLGNIPVGIIMAIIGSPIFFILIVWHKKGAGVLYRCQTI